MIRARSGNLWDNEKVMSAMDLGAGVREQLLQLVYTVPSARLVFTLRDFAHEVLVQGYPREQLLDDFEAVRSELREDDEEAREDAVMDVMDFLYGWSSRHSKL
jgi:hypothetical protein